MKSCVLLALLCSVWAQHPQESYFHHGAPRPDQQLLSEVTKTSPRHETEQFKLQVDLSFEGRRDNKTITFMETYVGMASSTEGGTFVDFFNNSGVGKQYYQGAAGCFGCLFLEVTQRIYGVNTWG